jgi:uncharacterized protein (DUF433 family)
MKRELLVVQAEQVEDRCLDVVDVDGVLRDVEAEIVGGEPASARGATRRPPAPSPALILGDQGCPDGDEVSSAKRALASLTDHVAPSYALSMDTSDLITIDPEILGGTPVFKGTRVPVKTLFEYLEDNYSLDEFLECFPSVTRQMAQRLLERSESALLSSAAA